MACRVVQCPPFASVPALHVALPRRHRSFQLRQLLHYLVETVRDFCQFETFNASCSDGSVILMKSARYGRMRLGRCLDTDLYMDCSADVLTHMDSRCSGRPTCSVTIPDSALHQQQPCPKDMVAYLETSYACVQGRDAVTILSLERARQTPLKRCKSMLYKYEKSMLIWD